MFFRLVIHFAVIIECARRWFYVLPQKNNIAMSSSDSIINSVFPSIATFFSVHEAEAFSRKRTIVCLFFADWLCKIVYSVSFLRQRSLSFWKIKENDRQMHWRYVRNKLTNRWEPNKNDDGIVFDMEKQFTASSCVFVLTCHFFNLL